MANMATRPVRGLVTLIVVVVACMFFVPNFSMLGGSVQRAPTTSRTITHASSVQFPSSGSTTMKTIAYTIDKVKSRFQGRAWLASPTQQELDEYDQKMSADIEMLEELVQSSLDVSTTTEVEWLESVVETVGQLKERLARQRAAEASARMPMLLAAGSFLLVVLFVLFLAVSGFQKS